MLFKTAKQIKCWRDLADDFVDHYPDLEVYDLWHTGAEERFRTKTTLEEIIEWNDPNPSVPTQFTFLPALFRCIETPKFNCDCPTMIKLVNHVDYHFAKQFPEIGAIQRGILKDDRIPRSWRGINTTNIYAFAEWQERFEQCLVTPKKQN